MKYEVSWGSGSSDLFLQIENKKLVILDYEYDTNRLHELCGGYNYYSSRSGASGAGYFTNLGSLLPLGTYRTDTVHNDWQCFLPIGKINNTVVSVAIPYESHLRDKDNLLNYSSPTIIKFGTTVVYCDFYRNFIDLLSLILSGEDLPDKYELKKDGYIYPCRGHHTMTKIFSKINVWNAPVEDLVTLEFYNFCSMEKTPNPWEFLSGDLSEYSASTSEEVMYRLLGVEQLTDDTFARVLRFDTRSFRGSLIHGDPLETGELTAGWKRLADDVIIRYYDKSNSVHLVSYELAKVAYEKMVRRLAYRLGEGDEFIKYVSNSESKYVEYELEIPKVLWLIDQNGRLAELRKGLAAKVRKDVYGRARSWIDHVNDKAILEVAPDDFIITIEDSLDAGNCLPGTERFISEYFPGRTSCTVGELKKYSDNYNVMRIFRHLVAVGRFGDIRKLA